MTILNATPFRDDEEDIRDLDGGHARIFLLKATFAIGADGSLAPSETQRDICEGPSWLGALGASSMIEDSDWAPVKHTTDIAIIGSIHAPRDHVATMLTPSFRIGRWHKRIRVTGDRRIHREIGGSHVDQPRPFRAMPIAWERCFGGKTSTGKVLAENPIGCGQIPADSHTPSIMPNFERPDAPCSPGHGTPDGLGFVDRGWKPRIAFAGSYDDTWMTYRRPLWPLDIDIRYFNSSRADMTYPGFLQGGERVALSQCLPGGDLQMSLPRMRIAFEGRLRRGRFQVPGVLDTCLIDLDAPSLTLVWRAKVRIAANENESDVRLVVHPH
ncbi:DUF2169 domain-containing protein [Puniceibacterium sp. IMCC21224]|uniref:DUF2169 family type VI secretion system accessory protein n=1 Tax=Puniceibacterium sp. IMCC21224 TaxID=1618204 RepID=UPI00064DAD2A|nr:DUF2169 domain-containing protein [Puniceibacterium sp. IMCC21224]KMK69027.1 hypothetical protein IMCC21224_113915 [Puniceibacterium sp. IMCC21224]